MVLRDNVKKSVLLVFSLALLMMFAVSCEGPAGPPGADGQDGTDGVDANATCTECHDNSQAMFAREIQWAASTHATGGNFERNSGDCAVCHTSQGFLGNLDGSYDATADGAMISNPAPPNCYTCHNIHDSYTDDDYALTVSGAIELMNVSETYDFGKASVCASCHQGRTVDPWPVAGGADIAITSSRYGLHHGPQANVFAGEGLFDAGSGYSGNGAFTHAGLIEDACVTCHMAEPYGVQAGGHTMKMGYDYHGSLVLNTAGCVDCHTADEAETKMDDLDAEIQGQLDSLKTLLDATGATAPGSDSSVPGTYSAVVAGAVLNYKALTEDRSLGVHNPAYVRYILSSTITALNNE
ncbi:MAG: hypothetical protein K9N11_01600 [Lentisphaeria bacterium]|nr:hypothetical protein [Candidatus Neomarinimicrobiota bacterium]MCF7841523.1 hypothetical protein [Lentisphaeria bacterium]